MEDLRHTSERKFDPEEVDEKFLLIHSEIEYIHITLSSNMTSWSLGSWQIRASNPLTANTEETSAFWKLRTGPLFATAFKTNFNYNFPDPIQRPSLSKPSKLSKRRRK